MLPVNYLFEEAKSREGSRSLICLAPVYGLSKIGSAQVFPDKSKFMRYIYRTVKALKAALRLLPLLFFFTACAPAPPETEFVLGTFCTVNLYEGGKPGIYRAVFSRLRELEDILSANREGTDLDLVNRSAGFAPVRVRPELITVLDRALYYADLSGGAFDPSVGPLVKLWGIGADTPRVPAEDEIRKTLGLVNWRDIEIDRKAGTVFLRRPGMALDLGAIAKGYAADEVVSIIAAAGVKRAVIDLGGNVFAYGEKQDRKPWRIGVQDPRDIRGAYIGILELRNRTVVTSGVYERFFEEGGRRYHHILSTGTGFPAETGLFSVTIVAGNSIDADALSTAAFVLGWEKGRALIEAVPGAGGIFVFEDLKVRLTKDLEGVFSLSGGEYRMGK
jgi:thiamine biosynthesis lipoprotein